ncbi:uncharacterized protein ATNIH1004_008374 [Aspergillus tanneri]|uniref:Uncharacterized protein n=1 Tax=Aspergillus tanneri TaxID=1220188 RepID=A0A5M9MAU6_9EURO|nr:uncharacterized protein ATNIH1004_008374 [Aspergillus tanneri]KAA8644175.1 hypothetical protein ATNIH1004_008374 [Aspergillus tanneri]
MFSILHESEVCSRRRDALPMQQLHKPAEIQKSTWDKQLLEASAQTIEMKVCGTTFELVIATALQLLPGSQSVMYGMSRAYLSMPTLRDNERRHKVVGHRAAQDTERRAAHRSGSPSPPSYFR